MTDNNTITANFDYQKLYYQMNKDRIKERMRLYYNDNRDDRLKYNKLYHAKYYQNNKDQMKEKMRLYYKNNRDEVLEQRKDKYYNIDRFKQIQCKYCNSFYNFKYITKHQQSKKCLNFQQQV